MDRSLQGRKWSLGELIYLAQSHPHQSGSQDNALDHDSPNQCEDHPFQLTKSQGNVLTFFCWQAVMAFKHFFYYLHTLVISS